jgi:hypothetical protein
MLWSRSINSSLVALIKMALERYPGGMTTRLRTKQDDKGSIQKQTNTAHLRSRWKRMLDRLTLTLLTVAAAVASNDRKRFLLEMRWNLPWYLQKEVLRLSDQSAIPYRTNEFRRVFNKMDVDFLKLNSDCHGFSYGPCSLRLWVSRLHSIRLGSWRRRKYQPRGIPKRLGSYFTGEDFATSKTTNLTQGIM